MTVTEAKNKILALARSYVGYHEEANNGNIFARDPEVIKAYGWNVDNLPWCDIFYDFLFCHTFGAELARQMTYQTGGMSAACAGSMDFYRANWELYTTPQVGDQIFFNVSGGVNHTGIVEEINGNLIRTIEGNTSDGVYPRTYNLGDKSIAGYGRPDWALVETDEDDEEITCPPSPAGTTEGNGYSYFHLCPGDGMSAPEERVAFMQLGLRLHGFPIEADGEFGPLSEAAVIKLRQSRDIGDSGETDEIFWKEIVKFEV